MRRPWSVPGSGIRARRQPSARTAVGDLPGQPRPVPVPAVADGHPAADDRGDVPVVVHLDHGLGVGPGRGGEVLQL
jgi:hypothetical protein